jgi:hypothetical protein
MPAPPVYLDECVDRPFAEALRQRGFTIVTAREAGMLGAADDAHLSYATQMDLVTLSYNRVDFVRWHRAWMRQKRAHGGIIVLPQEPPLVRRVLRAAMMLDWIADRDYRSKLFKWGDLQQEFARGYRLPAGGYTEEEVRQALGQL